MAELRNCPFCGGEANIVTYQGSKRIFYIECKGCNALMGNPRIMISAMKGKLYFENEAELIEAWNTRKPMEAVVAELEKRANDNDRAADRLSGIESKKKITSWRARAEALRDAAEIVRGKE